MSGMRCCFVLLGREDGFLVPRLSWREGLSFSYGFPKASWKLKFNHLRTSFCIVDDFAGCDFVLFAMENLRYVVSRWFWMAGFECSLCFQMKSWQMKFNALKASLHDVYDVVLFAIEMCDFCWFQSSQRAVFLFWVGFLTNVYHWHRGFEGIIWLMLMILGCVIWFCSQFKLCEFFVPILSRRQDLILVWFWVIVWHIMQRCWDVIWEVGDERRFAQMRHQSGMEDTISVAGSSLLLHLWCDSVVQGPRSIVHRIYHPWPALRQHQCTRQNWQSSNYVSTPNQSQWCSWFWFVQPGAATSSTGYIHAWSHPQGGKLRRTSATFEAYFGVNRGHLLALAVADHGAVIRWSKGTAGGTFKLCGVRVS